MYQYLIRETFLSSQSNTIILRQLFTFDMSTIITKHLYTITLKMSLATVIWVIQQHRPNLYNCNHINTLLSKTNITVTSQVSALENILTFESFVINNWNTQNRYHYFITQKHLFREIFKLDLQWMT